MPRHPILIIGGAGETGARVNALRKAPRDFSDDARATAVGRN